MRKARTQAALRGNRNGNGNGNGTPDAAPPFATAANDAYPTG